MVIERTRMINRTLAFPRCFIKACEKIQSKGLTPSRSESVRMAVRSFLFFIRGFRREMEKFPAGINTILTVNLPKGYIESMKNMCGPGKLFNSVSECMRFAYIHWLMEELPRLETFQRIKDDDLLPELGEPVVNE